VVTGVTGVTGDVKLPIFGPKGRYRRPKGATGEEASEASFLARTRGRQDSDQSVTGVTGDFKLPIFGPKDCCRRECQKDRCRRRHSTYNMCALDMS
jgi:hypothetical protein